MQGERPERERDERGKRDASVEPRVRDAEPCQPERDEPHAREPARELEAHEPGIVGPRRPERGDDEGRQRPRRVLEREVAVGHVPREDTVAVALEEARPEHAAPEPDPRQRAGDREEPAPDPGRSEGPSGPL